MTQLFIEGFEADMYKDLSTAVTYAIDDLKDFGARNTSYSKTIVLPGTANNNQLFGNIFMLGHSNSSSATASNIKYNFNASLSAKCILFQDRLQVFAGTLRLLEIVSDEERIEYEVALNGALTNLNTRLSGGFLTDLDFSQYDHLYTTSNISLSWNNSNFLPGSGYVYPLIDYGAYTADKHNWDIRTLRPAIYVKEYIDKIMANSFFRYESDFFNTDRFKRLIIPNNFDRLRNISSNILNASEVDAILQVLPLAEKFIEFDTVDPGSFNVTLNNSRFEYFNATTINATLNLKLNIPPTEGLTLVVEKNDVGLFDDLFENINGINLSIPTQLINGDFIRIRVKNETNSPVGATPFNLDLSCVSDIGIPSVVGIGQQIKMNEILPRNIRQIDFLISIIKLFNLYVTQDRFDESLLRFTPFVDFFSTDSSNSVDWTYKLNREKPMKIKPMSELNSKIYEFKYKDDTDFFNNQYKKRYNQQYGVHIYDTNFEFSSSKNTLELIFAPTPIVGYQGEDKYYSTIFKKSNDIEENVDSVIRILQTKFITGVSSWNILDNGSPIVSLTNYLYAGHFDDPVNITNDLNFGILKELYFSLQAGDLTKTQFNIYWSPYMAEITDKDSKLLKAKFYLTARDINELDFSKYVYVDGVIFRLNKIIDYNASSPTECEAELIKVINTVY